MIMKKLVLILIVLLFSFLKAEAQHVDVVYATDDNYVIYTLISINSILQNNKSNSDYTFYIVENGINDRNRELMKNYVEKHGHEIQFYYVDPLTVDKKNRLYNNLSRVPSLSVMRVVLPDILPSNIHRLVYLDGDTIVTGNFTEFYNLDLEGKPLGMVKDISEELRMRITGVKKGYYNGGIMLMDIDKWKEENITKILLDSMENRYEDYVKFGFADQDLISVALEGKIKTLPPNWNNQTMYGMSTYDLDTAGMIHYIYVKPWIKPKLSLNDKAYIKYYEYWNKSGLKKYKYLTFWNIIKNRLYLSKINVLIDCMKKDRYLTPENTFIINNAFFIGSN